MTQFFNGLFNNGLFNRVTFQHVTNFKCNVFLWGFSLSVLFHVLPDASTLREILLAYLFLLHQVDMHWFEVGKSPSKKNGLICFNESPLKSGPHLPKKILFICFNKSPLKMMKNAFYFIVKARFFLEIFKFLSWLFRHVEKTTWLERQGSFQNLWRHNLVNKQWQYTYWPISHQVQALYEAKESSLQLSFNHFR